MATVTEIFESGEGDSDGFGGTFATRRFNVRLVATDTDSFTGELDDVNNPIAPIAARYPLGSPHNIVPGLIAWNHSKPRRKRSTFGFWVVEIDYETPLILNVPPTDQWQIRYNTAIETEQMVRAFLLDARGRRIGDRQVPVGGRAYRAPKDGETPAQFFGDTVAGGKELVRVESDDIVTPADVSRFAAVTGFSLRRTVANMNTSQTNAADSFVALANAQIFFGKGPGRVLIGPYTIDSRSGKLPNQIQLAEGTVFDVELNFLVNRNGWTVTRIFDTFADGEYRVTVKDNQGVEQFRDFETYPRANALDFLQIFAPAAKGGPRPRPLP